MTGEEQITKILSEFTDRYKDTRRGLQALADAKSRVGEIVANANFSSDISTKLYSKLLLAVMQDLFEKGELVCKISDIEPERS